MNTETLILEKKKVAGSWLKRTSVLTASIIVALVVVNAIWTYSGSGQWRLIRDKTGIKVYALKTSGSTLEQFKGTARLRATLPTVLKLTVDPVMLKALGGYGARYLGGDEYMSFSYFRMDPYPPLPFRPRESVLSVLKYQNTKTQELLLQVRAVPDKIPPSDCCFRVTQMNNSWRFRPIGVDQVDIEWLLNEDLGGMVPDSLKNHKWPNLMFNFLALMQDRAHVYEKPAAK